MGLIYFDLRKVETKFQSGVQKAADFDKAKIERELKTKNRWKTSDRTLPRDLTIL